MFLFMSVLLMFYMPLSQMFNFEVTDVDMYGKMLIANENFVVSIINRTYPSFGFYRPYSSNDFCQIDMNFLAPNETYIMLMAIARDGSAASNRLFFQGVRIYNNVANYSVWGVVDFSWSSCNWISIYYSYGVSIYDYPLLGAGTTGDICLYTPYNFTTMYQVSSGNTSNIGGTPWPDGSNFIPYTIDIAFNGWGVIAGAVPNSNGVYVPILYLITFPSSVFGGSYNYVVLQRWTAPFLYVWQNQIARPISGPTDFNPMYGLSLSINNQGDILFGVQSMNTVFHLYVDPANPTSFIFKGSRIYSTTIPSIGFGKSVGWLDNTTAVILANNVSLDYTFWYSSQIEIYDLSNGNELSDTQQPYSSFPTAQQSMYSMLTGRILLMTASYAGSVIFMDSNGQVYIILPSSSGYYTQTNVGNTLGPGIYFSSSALCPDGTSSNGFTGSKYLFDTCQPCPVGTFRSTATNITGGCVPCNTALYFCPFGAVAEVPLSYIDQISQAVAFPQSPDLTGFEDILLLNMFNTNFQTNCLVTTPFFWTLIMLGVAAIILITMAIIRLSGKCENFRTKIESIFRHLDIIKGGQRWMGGVLSLTIFIIIIFAALFTNSFIKQYPQENSRAPDFSCDATLRNSQFSSQMQSLGAAVTGDAQTIFNVLQSQQFILSVTLLNTISNTNTTVTETVGTITKTLQCNFSVPTNGCLIISCNLTSNIATININISSSQAIGGVRISLSALSIVNQNSQAKELYFANSFTMTNRTMSQEPYFSIELFQVINETKPLSATDVSQYSGLWIPIFTKDDDRNFYILSDFEKYHTQLFTILTIDINQAAYYVYNIEKPIIKTRGVIFKNILFASMCMELFGFAFLIFKLVIVPSVQLIMRLIRPKEKESKEENDNDDGDSDDNEKEEKEEENKSDDDDDDEEIPQKIKFGFGKNEWYMPDVKI